MEDRSLLSLFTVTSSNDHGPGSLRDTIAAAASGDTIRFGASLIGATITLTGGELQIDKSLDIEGLGADRLTISGYKTGVFDISPEMIATISGLTITGGQADYGGGIYNEGTLTVTNCAIIHNTAGGSGGGIYSYGTLTVTNCTINDNAVGGAGGGICQDGSSLTVANCTISENTASFGGGISCYGGATITNSTISENVVNGDSEVRGAGGGIENSGGGLLTIVNCTICGNTANDGDGGGVWNLSPSTDSTLTITNCTIARNTAGGYGGGVYIDVGLMMMSEDSTALGYASDGPALDDGSLGTCLLSNTIVADNTGGVDAPDILGSVTANYCLIQDPNGATIDGTGNILNQDPLFGTLDNYGGPTRTIPTLPDSLARNTGRNALALGRDGSTLLYDQRGLIRVAGGTVDMGAFEAQEQTIVFTLGDKYTYGTTIALTATGGASGLPVSFAVVSGGEAASLDLMIYDLTVIKGVGYVTVEATQPGNEEYLPATPVDRSFDAMPAPLTIRATDQSKVYGEGLPALEVTYAGYVLEDTAASLTSPPTTTTPADAGSHVGTYPITASGAADPNYSISYVDGTLTVTRASLTIAADSSSKVYGKPLPALTVSYSGFVAGDTAASLTSQPTATTPADAGSHVGTYPITASGAVDPDYSISYVDGTLTVTPAPLTITATTDTKQYDSTTASSATPTYSPDPLYNGDTLTNLSQAFLFKNVLGNGGSTLVVVGYTLNDGNGGENYAVTLVDAVGTITPAPLTIAATTDTKQYDGTTTSGTVPTHSPDPLYDGDTLTGLAQAFASKNVLGNGASVLTVTAYTLNDGNDGNNYTVTLVNARGTITPAPLTIRASTDTKPYDGTTTSSAAPTYSPDPLYDGDTLTGLAQAFASKNVLGNGGSTLEVSHTYKLEDGNNGNNYAVTLENAVGTITAAPLRIRATSDTKPYDGTVVSSAVPTYSPDPLYDGDTLTGLAQAFASKNVLGNGGSSLEVSHTYKLDDGNGGNNYVVTLENAVGTITAAPLTIRATSDAKPYDGTVVSSAVPTYSPDPLYDGDTLTNLSQAFVSKNVQGSGGSTLAVTAYMLNDGNGGHNYEVALVGAAGTITPIPLTALGIIAGNKIYDGTTQASLDYRKAVLPGVLPGDTVTLNTDGASGSFDSKDPGIGKTVTVSGLTIGGSDAGNYTLRIPTIAANIIATTTVGTITGQSAVFGGVPTAAVVPLPDFVRPHPVTLTLPSTREFGITPADHKTGGLPQGGDMRRLILFKVDALGVQEQDGHPLAKDAFERLPELLPWLSQVGLPNGRWRIFLQEPGYPPRFLREFSKWGNVIGDPVQEPGPEASPLPRAAPKTDAGRSPEDSPAAMHDRVLRMWESLGRLRYPLGGIALIGLAGWRMRATARLGKRSGQGHGSLQSEITGPRRPWPRAWLRASNKKGTGTSQTNTLAVTNDLCSEPVPFLLDAVRRTRLFPALEHDHGGLSLLSRRSEEHRRPERTLFAVRSMADR